MVIPLPFDERVVFEKEDKKYLLFEVSGMKGSDMFNTTHFWRIALPTVSFQSWKAATEKSCGEVKTGMNSPNKTAISCLEKSFIVKCFLHSTRHRIQFYAPHNMKIEFKNSENQGAFFQNRLCLSAGRRQGRPETVAPKTYRFVKNQSKRDCLAATTLP